MATVVDRPATIGVGPFEVLDASKQDVLQTVVDSVVDQSQRPITAYALHVGGLNHRTDAGFVSAMRSADFVYADGGAVVLLAKLAGASDIERAPTTDIGWDLLCRLGLVLGRPPRIALVGGRDGVAREAGEVLERAGAGVVVAVAHGFHDEWDDVLASVSDAEPDVVIVGLGAPREMVWVEEHRDRLPSALVLTCGGWFGFLTGEEQRAPRLLCRSGLEWTARVAQSPRRLLPRYAVGLASIFAMAPAAVRSRPVVRAGG